MKITSLRLRPAILAASIAALAASAPRARAIDRFWNPMSGSSWFTNANWSASSVPSFGDVAVFNSNTSNPTFPSLANARGLRFDAPAAGFVFGGSEIQLGVDGIQQNSNSIVTINNPLTLVASQSWGGAGTGVLTVGGLVSLNGYAMALNRALTVSNTGTLAFGGSGSITGFALLTLDGGQITSSGSVYGINSLVAKNGAAITANNWRIGYNGTGSFSVESGSTMSASGTINVGASEMPTPGAFTFAVTGVGSSVTAGGLDIGSFSGTSVQVSGGGALTVGTTNLGGSLMVSGGTFTSASTNGANFGSSNSKVEVSGGTANLGIYTQNLNTAGLFLTGGVTRVTGNYFVGDQSLGNCLNAQLNLPSGATLEVSGGVTVVAGTGNGALNLTGGTLRAASLTRTTGLLGGAFSWSGGTVGITGAGGVTLGAGQVFGSSTSLGATQTLQITNTLTVPGGTTMILGGGRLEVGALVNQGSFQFFTGTLAVTGAGGFAIGAGEPLGDQVSLPFGAKIEVSNALSIASGAEILLGGTLSGGIGSAVASGARIVLQNGSGRITGTGTLTNSGLLTGDGRIDKPVTNAAGGEIRGEAGKTLLFTRANGTNSGRINLLGGTVQFSQPLANGAAGQINGAGVLVFPTSPVPSSVFVTAPTAGLDNAGRLSFSGGDTQVYGTVQMLGGSRLIASGGATATFFDVFRHNGAEVKASAGSALVFFGEVRGGGSFTGTGTVYMEGGYSPGNSPAAVTLDTEVVFGDAATLTLELGGLTAGSGYDQLMLGANGSLALDGALVLDLINGFTPAAGDSFAVFDFAPGQLTGSFDEILFADALPSGLSFDTTQLTTTGRIGVVPEPGTAALLLGGLTLLGLLRRHRQ